MLTRHPTKAMALRTTTIFLVLSLSQHATEVLGHGHMTWPPSTRNFGSIALGADCDNGACYWFTNNIEIPGPPTLPHHARSVQLNVTDTVEDVYKTSPWRAPGSATVYGSGCGIAGGHPTIHYANGGNPPEGIAQGVDGLTLPTHGNPAVWVKGEVAEVAFAISANHAGGYAYRLCKNSEDGTVTEQCFQQGHLKFAEPNHWLIYPNGTRSQAFPMTRITEGTVPAGSEWARVPVPACYACDAYTECGAPMPPPTDPQIARAGSSCWNTQVNCYGRCAGTGSQEPDQRCPEGQSYFPEGLPHISGFGKSVWEWSVLDKVQVPSDIEAGSYLLSWRWDCEESTQVWNNCADIVIVDEPNTVASAPETFSLITPESIALAPGPARMTVDPTTTEWSEATFDKSGKGKESMSKDANMSGGKTSTGTGKGGDKGDWTYNAETGQWVHVDGTVYEGDATSKGGSDGKAGSDGKGGSDLKAGKAGNDPTGCVDGSDMMVKSKDTATSKDSKDSKTPSSLTTADTTPSPPPAADVVTPPTESQASESSAGSSSRFSPFDGFVSVLCGWVLLPVLKGIAGI